MCRLILNLLQFGQCFAIRLSTASFIYSCFEIFVVKRKNACTCCEFAQNVNEQVSSSIIYLFE